jgi:pimeloyl-ACP methyl ester carboxylesterase
MSDDITPFRVDVPEAELEDLRERLRRTRWPEAETVDDWSQGIPLDYTRRLCEHWLARYDWRAAESRLNQKVIEPLTDPVAFGGDAADAFHVVCPSLPGYGFSGKPGRTGWGSGATADAWDQLMARLGYPRYAAQGGDWGAQVTTALAMRHPDHLAGIHLNMVIAFPDPSDELTEREQAAMASVGYYDRWDSGYSKEQSTRPQTVGYGLVDSPAGLCAWIVEKFWAWTDCDGDPANVLTVDEMLDNVMLYWVTGAGASSARFYWESFRQPFLGPVHVPAGCSIFPKEIFRPSRRWAERQLLNLQYWNELDKGGHFAAFEQPETFVTEVRASFRPLR